MSLLAEYQAQRASLIDNDRSLRRENLTVHLRSDKELEADRIVRKIRAKEAETIWKEEHPSIPHPFPGMEFLTGMLRVLLAGRDSKREGQSHRQVNHHEDATF